MINQEFTSLIFHKCLKKKCTKFMGIIHNWFIAVGVGRTCSKHTTHTWLLSFALTLTASFALCIEFLFCIWVSHSVTMLVFLSLKNCYIWNKNHTYPLQAWKKNNVKVVVKYYFGKHSGRPELSLSLHNPVSTAGTF